MVDTSSQNLFAFYLEFFSNSPALIVDIHQLGDILRL